MSYREAATAPHMFNEFIDHSKTDIQNPFLSPQPVSPHPVYIPHAQTPTMVGRNTLGELSTSSKAKKYFQILLIAGGFVGVKVLMKKYAAEVSEVTNSSPVAKQALAEIKSVQIPIVLLLMAGPALQLIANRDWPTLTTLGDLSALGLALYKVVPGILPLVSAVRKARKKRNKK
jgi:hypothetical protein